MNSFLKLLLQLPTSTSTPTPTSTSTPTSTLWFEPFTSFILSSKVWFCISYFGQPPSPQSGWRHKWTAPNVVFNQRWWHIEKYCKTHRGWGNYKLTLLWHCNKNKNNNNPSTLRICIEGMIQQGAIFVQGAVVQGQLCPRDISPRKLLPEEILVQGDFCPRCKFETLMAAHIVFFHSNNQSIS